ncbi:MAG TPA: hypothetical protein VEF04_17320, partial [Blastocatellia bacterium]|nr:hypothetical protein [Blastocatellia bacterium]
SRYDLPTFVVNVKPDKGYYLPGQNAEVEVRADYLFGQPVKKGKVKVVREEERRWNYREQKYDVIEKDKYEGETDAEGRFVAHVKLDDAHEDIADQDYKRFEDVSYAAYFTDETTGRTEQRRFDIRVTKEEIHVYVIEIDRGLAPNFPTQFYVSTSYADGSPASCEVAISKFTKLDDNSIKATLLTTVKTNNYGLARVTGLRLTENEDEDAEIKLGLKATGQNGKLGSHTDNTHWEQKPLIRVETDKSLYRPGEPIRAVITSNVPNLRVLVDIAQDGHLLKWQDVQLRDGRAEILVPYQREFQNLVTVTAFSRNKTDSNVYFPIGSRAVLYPHDDELKLEVQTKKTTYQPNEEALIEVRARTSDKRAAQSVIGAVVIDRAVEERARTDGEFKGRFGFDSYFYHSGRPQSFAGFTLNDLKKIDLSKPLPNGFDLVAEVVLSQMGGDLNWMYSGDDFTTDQSEAFGPTIKLQLKPIETALETQYKERGVYPKDKASLENILTSSQINFADYKDPWGTPYLVEFSTETQHDLLTFVCAGADKRFDTADDFSVLTMKQEYFRFIGEAMKRAVEIYQARTGDYVRDEITLKAELKREGIDFDSLRDPWGQPYSIGFRLGYGSYSVNV